MKEFIQAVRYLGHYLKRYWRGLLFAMIFVLIGTYAQIKAPVYLGKAVTDMAKYLAEYMNPLTHNQASMSSFYQAIWSMVGFYALTEVGLVASGILTSRISSQSTGKMRVSLFSKLQRMTIRYFDTHQDGKILSLFTSDLDNLYNAMNQAIFQVFSQGILFFGIIWMMFEQSATMAWVTMALTPVVFLIAGIIIRQARQHIDDQQNAVSDMNGYINEQINGEKIIITEGLQAKSVRNFAPYNQKVQQETYKGQVYSGMLMPVMQGLSLLNLAIVIFFGSWLVLHSGMNRATGLGLVVVFVNYSQQYFQPITQITSVYNTLQLAFTGANRLSRVQEEVEEVNTAQGKQLPALAQAVDLKHVDFGYSAKHEILHDVSIDVKKGQMVALVGPTGSGKTTVMNLLNRFYDVNQGEVAFDGVDIRQFDLQSLRDRVGIVLQESVIFSRTIAENIKFGKPNATDAEMIDAAKQANIHDFIMSLPAGYQTLVSDENSVFSTGQKQLLSIARTILTSPDFLILDEATSNVDTVTEAKIQEAMNNVIAGRTSFVIAHRLKTILGADKIVVLKDGRVIEQGNHTELLRKDGFYAELYHNQMVFE